jgi:hypothetical protein
VSSQDEGIVDVERRKNQVEYTLGDPTVFPPEFLNWLKRFIEQSGITLPASAIFGSLVAGGGSGSLLNIAAGVVLPFAGPVAPAGSILCNGQQALINDYPKLHEIIGANWGPETATTFTIPDFRGRALYGAGTNIPFSVTDLQAENLRGAKHRHTASTNADRMKNLGTNTGFAGGGGDGFPDTASVTLTVGPPNTPLDGPGFAGINYVITTG